MEMTLGFYCSPKRDVLSPKSFIEEAVLKLWGKLPDFCYEFMSFEGLNCLQVSVRTHTGAGACRTSWFMLPNALSTVSKRSIFKNCFNSTFMCWILWLCTSRGFLFFFGPPQKSNAPFFISNNCFLACTVFFSWTYFSFLSTSSGSFFKERFL